MSQDSPDVDYRLVVDAIPRAVIVSDSAGVILLWNDEAERLYGWSSAETVGRSVLDVLSPPDDEPKHRTVLESVAGGRETESDRVLIRKNGESIRVSSVARRVEDSSGQPAMIVGVSTDVTDLRIEEQRVRDLNEHFRLSLEAGGLGTWRWEMASGVTVWDERLEDVYGLPSGGFDGTYERWAELLHPDDREKILETVQRAVDTESPYKVEHRIVHADGGTRWISGEGKVTLDEYGLVTGTIGCVTDITERVERDVERRRLAELAESSAHRERVQRERLEFTSRINDILTTADTTDEILAKVTCAAVPRLGDWCALHLLPADGGAVPATEIAHVDPSMVTFARDLQERFPYDPHADVGVARVIRTGETEFYPDIDDAVLSHLDATDEERAIIDQLALRSSITVALHKRGRTFGAMQFVMSSSSRRYSEEDVALAEAVAGRIAASLDNRRLYDRQREIAHTLQSSLLPSALPSIEGIDVAVRYSAAGEGAEVGGDFYDLFQITDDQWAIVIGDACGTGAAAASLTGLARQSIRESAWHGDDPDHILFSLNRSILRSGADSFCTCVFAVLGLNGQELNLSVACGGHPGPVLVRDGQAMTLGEPGTLIGMLPTIEVTTTNTVLRSGDSLIFYTDGATDLPPPHGLKAEQMRELILDAVTATADGTAQQIQQALDGILPFAARGDDLALLVIRVC